MNGIAIQFRNMLETGPKVGCFVGFCHHFNDHECVYACVLLESGTKTGLRMIALCRKDRGLLT